MIARVLRLVGFAFPLAAIGAAAWGVSGAVELRGTEPRSSEAERARIVRVVDGDTFVVLLGGRERTVRLLGLDAPESVHPTEPVECWGSEAAASLTRVAPQGARVRVARDPTQAGRDRFGRLLRYADVGGVDVGREQLRRGAASLYVFEDRFRRIGAYRETERAAMRQGRGMWGSCGDDRGTAP